MCKRSNKKVFFETWPKVIMDDDYLMVNSKTL